MRILGILISMIFLVLWFSSLQATTLHVPGDYLTIQDGIDAAIEGDTVLVASGTYTGPGNRDIDFLGKAIVVMSEAGAESTIIDCGGSPVDQHRGFIFNSGEGPDSKLVGFAIRNGYMTTSKGAGIACKNTSPTIMNCVIEGNTTENEHGGGILCKNGASPTFIGCVITGNTTEYYGGGIYLYQNEPSPTLINCTISGNSALNGGGIYSDVNGHLTLIHCTIARNTASAEGGGLYLSDNSQTIGINNILWGDLPGEIYSEGYATVSFIYSDIEGGLTGEGNIDEDPLFVDVGNEDFHLQVGSPCIDRGTDAGVFLDIDDDWRPSGCGFEIGSDEFVHVGPGVLVYPLSYSLIATVDSMAADDTLIVGNVGTEDLEYSVNLGNGSWLSLDGEVSGVLAPNDSAVVVIRYDFTGMDHGNYEDTITVVSNDSLYPSISVPISLTLLYPNVIYVPTDVATIQEGIELAEDGDTVLVMSGIYTGDGNRDIDFMGKAIVVMSEAGAESTIIDCGGSLSDPHRGFNFHTGEGLDSRLDGFTIQNGYITWEDYGGGIKCAGSSPTISNCTIIGNTSEFLAGGIYCGNSSPTISNCVINGNTTSLYGGYGGGIYCSNSSPYISDCTIEDNMASFWGGGIGTENNSSPTIRNCSITGNSIGGIFCTSGGDPTIMDCLISVNYGSGLAFDGTNPVLLNCTISGNMGAGAEFYGSISHITNCIFWNNEWGELNYDVEPDVNYSDIEGGWPRGEGNIDADPLFINQGSGDFHLQWGSPCIDAGDPSSQNIPWGGWRRDMGAFEYDQGFYYNGWVMIWKPTRHETPYLASP